MGGAALAVAVAVWALRAAAPSIRICASVAAIISIALSAYTSPEESHLPFSLH